MQYVDRPDNGPSGPKIFMYKLNDGLWISNDEKSFNHIFDVFKLQLMS